MERQDLFDSARLALSHAMVAAATPSSCLAATDTMTALQRNPKPHTKTGTLAVPIHQPPTQQPPVMHEWRREMQWHCISLEAANCYKCYYNVVRPGLHA